MKSKLKGWFVFNIYVVFKCKDGLREKFIERVYSEKIVDEIRAENGCIRYDYYFTEKDKNEILLIETWESREHQQVHLTQPHMEKLREFKDDYILSTIIGEFDFK